MNEKLVDTIDVDTLDVTGIQVPFNLNTAWVEYFFKTLGIPYTQVIHTYCYKEFYEHYGKYRDKFLEVCRNSKTGSPALILYNMYKEDIIDENILMEFLDDDKLNRRHVELVKYYVFTQEPTIFKKYEDDVILYEESESFLNLRASGLVRGI